MNHHIAPMNYHTHKKKLVLPEYGRVIHEMVDHCLTIQDRDQRNLCAHTIIDHMITIAPHRRDLSGSLSAFWDHLAVISGFKLDVDYPYEVIKPEEFNARPQKLPYPRHRMRYRHYGKIMENMIESAVALPEGAERFRLTRLIATHLKKAYLIWNKDTVSDIKIFDDLRELSSNQLSLFEDEVSLIDTDELLRLMHNNPSSTSTLPSPKRKNNNSNMNYRKRPNFR
jgi:hypothetical protein